MTKLEECARALCREQYIMAASFPGSHFDLGRVDQWVDKHWEKDVRAARAVIRCLMEPSEGMIEAGEDRDAFGGRAPAEIHFVAMLQSVLDESKE